MILRGVTGGTHLDGGVLNLPECVCIGQHQQDSKGRKELLLLRGRGPAPMNAHGQCRHLLKIHNRHDPLIYQGIKAIDIALLQAAIRSDGVQDVLGNGLDETIRRGGGLGMGGAKRDHHQEHERADKSRTSQVRDHHGASFLEADAPLETCWARLAR